jgi:hypothetical protein
MATSWTAIATTTVGSGGVSSVTFSSIPSTYTDLVIKASARSSRTDAPESYIAVRLNGATTAHTVRRTEGSGTSVYSSTESNNWSFMVAGSARTANSFSNTEIYVPTYNSSKYKSFNVVSALETNGSEAYMMITSGLWSSTAAVSSISIVDAAANLVQYSSFTLFGIKNS